jgi:hypothetical protein
MERWKIGMLGKDEWNIPVKLDYAFHGTGWENGIRTMKESERIKDKGKARGKGKGVEEWKFGRME